MGGVITSKSFKVNSLYPLHHIYGQPLLETMKPCRLHLNRHGMHKRE